jgi:hypothetical protein
MKSLKDIVMNAYQKLSPKIIIDESNRKVVLKDNLFFTHLTQAYYTLRNYSVKIE